MKAYPFELILASTSRYRRDLLSKLHIPFRQVDPQYKEIAMEGESALDKAVRLARGKAHAAQGLGSRGEHGMKSDKHLIFLGSDQVAECENRILSKPGSFENAAEQLMHCSGNWVTFSTGVAIIDDSGRELESFVEIYQLKFRQLSASRINEYLTIDEPFDCAGSIKAEEHGIVLIEETKGTDINTLYGLPLIRLTTILESMDQIG